MGIARIFLVLVIAGILGWIGLLGGAIETMPYRTSTAIFVPPAEAKPAGLAEGGAEAQAGAGLPAAAPAPTHVVRARALRLRAEPSTRAAVLASYLKGTEVVVSRSQAGWAEVRLPDGKSGWMFENWLTPKGDG